jgi:hypothetical protein
VASVTGNFGDHAQINESQAHSADEVVFDSVVQMVGGGQFVRASTCRHVFGDDVGEGFVVGDMEATVAPGGMAIACLDA